MNTHKRLFFANIIFIVPFILNALGSPSTAFMTINPGARAFSMGGAFSAIADDASATFYNPAGLAMQKSVDVLYDSRELYGIQFGYCGISLPISKRLAIGTFYTYMDLGEIYGVSTNYHLYDFVVGVSSGIKIFPNHSAGFTIKYIYSSGYVEIISKTLALDLSVLSLIPWKYGESGIGINIQNIGSQIQYKQLSDDPLVKFGFSHRINAITFMSEQKTDFWLKKWFLEQCHISVSYDVQKDIYASSSIKQAIGCELSPLAFFSFRFGYIFPQNHSVIKTIGYGLDWKFIKIDIGTDKSMQSIQTTDWHITVRVNIGTPLLSDSGIKGLFSDD